MLAAFIGCMAAIGANQAELERQVDADTREPFATEAELYSTSPVGLYTVVRAHDRSERETWRARAYDPETDQVRHHVPCRLMGRVRERGKKPVGVHKFLVRPDGKQVILAWVPIDE